MIDVETKGEEKLAYLFRMAPETFRRQFELWLWREKVAFVGSSKKDGKFTKELLNKPRKYRSGNYARFVARAFTGVVENKTNLDAMRLRMGIVRPGQQKNLPYLESLGFGGISVPRNKSWLMVPNYKNLSDLGYKYEAMGKLLANLYDRVHPVLHNGKLLVFDDNRKLLFTGIKTRQMTRQFNLEASWSKRAASVQKHGNTMIERTVRSLERGYLKAE